MNRARAAGYIADGAWIAAGALAIGSGIFFWLSRPNSGAKPEQATTRIVAGPQSVQLVQGF